LPCSNDVLTRLQAKLQKHTHTYTYMQIVAMEQRRADEAAVHCKSTCILTHARTCRSLLWSNGALTRLQVKLQMHAHTHTYMQIVAVEQRRADKAAVNCMSTHTHVCKCRLLPWSTNVLTRLQAKLQMHTHTHTHVHEDHCRGATAC